MSGARKSSEGAAAFQIGRDAREGSSAGVGARLCAAGHRDDRFLRFCWLGRETYAGWVVQPCVDEEGNLELGAARCGDDFDVVGVGVRHEGFVGCG